MSMIRNTISGTDDLMNSQQINKNKSEDILMRNDLHSFFESRFCYPTLCLRFGL